MKNGMRELTVLVLVGISVGAFFRYRENHSAAGINSSSKRDPRAELLVWSSENPVGKCWQNLGPGGWVECSGGSVSGKGSALTIHMKGSGFRGCGMNWKGWFPEDACDDASGYSSLVFYVRQLSAIDGADLTVSLVDNVKRPAGEVAGNQVAVLAEGGIPQIDGQWRKVVIPLERFAASRPLMLDRLWEIDFSNLGKDELVLQIDRIAFTMEQPAPRPFPSAPAFQTAATLDIQGPRCRISEGIYGVCDWPSDKLTAYGVAINRWGGNTSSRYNWKINADNGASDWYFKNRGTPMTSLGQTAYLKQIQSAQGRGGNCYLTVPTLGWVAKDFSSCSYPIRKFGPQRATEPSHPDVGNGAYPDGRLIRHADPRETSVEAGPEFIAEAVDFVVKNAGAAGAQGKPGVKYWVLDNEPMLWHETHRDVCPKPMSYDELWHRTVAYAEAIKKVDPTAKVAGFCSWGWTDLFYSAKDEGDDKYARQPDNRAHGEVPLGEWFIRKCGEYRKKNGKPLVDVFDFHWYPQCQVGGQSPFLGKGMDVGLNELRLRSTRDLWDPYYTQESWIRETVDRKPTQVILRVRDWIERYNPGMELCIGEYNFGGGDNITGGLAQADVFGILAREKVDLAFIWHVPEGTQELAWQLYRNYDGQGGRFGDETIKAESEHRHLSVHAARREDGAATIVAINKNLGSPCDLKLQAKGLKGNLQIWRFDQTTGRVVAVDAPVAAVDGMIELQLPAASASMLVIK